MPIISVNDVWKAFEWLNGRPAKDKALVAAWLDEISKELAALMSAWIVIVTDVESQIDSDAAWIASDPLRSRTEHGPDFSGALATNVQGEAYLREFYLSVSAIVHKEKYLEFHENLTHGLANILVSRGEARTIIDSISYWRFVEKPERLKLLENLKAAHRDMQRDAAELRVLIANFKAQ
jgi:hypothetical protein